MLSIGFTCTKYRGTIIHLCEEVYFHAGILYKVQFSKLAKMTKMHVL